MIPFELARDQPLDSDALIQERVTDLIGGAIRRQLWLLFLAPDEVQLPILAPCSDLPTMPPQVPLAILRELADACDAASIIAVLERTGDALLTEPDRAWARYLSESSRAVGVPLRAILLSHSHGVRWVAEDDYVF